MSFIVPREKPKCYNCQFRTLNYCGLLIEHDCVTVYVNEMSVSEYCPLVEIPTPHGRLGDLDKLKYDIVVGNQKYLGLNAPCLEDVTPIENVDDCIDAIAFAPTVIEAEWREE